MLHPDVADRAFKMIQTISDKHKGYMRTLDFDWYVLETYDSRYEIIQNVVPWLRIDFK